MGVQLFGKRAGGRRVPCVQRPYRSLGTNHFPITGRSRNHYPAPGRLDRFPILMSKRRAVEHVFKHKCMQSLDVTRSEL